MRAGLTTLGTAILGLASAACAAEGGIDVLKRALQASCFAPEALAASASELKAAKNGPKPAAPSGAVAALPGAPIAPDLQGAIRRVELPPDKKLIALTFDLCETRGMVAGYEGRIFDYLRQQNVRATVFAGGKWMRSHPERTRQLMSDPLYELANHGDTHRNLRALKSPALDEEILGAQRTYEAIRKDFSTSQCFAKVPGADTAVPARIGLFRFPYGACNPAALKAVNDAGLLAIQWDLSTGDPDPRISAAAIARNMLRNAKPGSIIIAHANGRGRQTAKALEIAIPKLKEAGFTFVTVSQLLAAGTPVIAAKCYNLRPGDTDRYDHPRALTQRARGQPETQGFTGLAWPEPSKPRKTVRPHAKRSQPFVPN